MRIPNQLEGVNRLNNQPSNARALVPSQWGNSNTFFSLRRRRGPNAVYAPQTPHGPYILQQNDCPEGTYPKVAHYPVYDENGLFVIGWRASVFCMPIDYEPAG